jgi:hypothetical protein
MMILSAMAGFPFYFSSLFPPLKKAIMHFLTQEVAFLKGEGDVIKG